MNSHVHPAFACVLDRIADAPLLLGELQRKNHAQREQERQDAADIAARFGEGLSLCDGPDERLELERDMHDDMVRRSA